MTTRVLDDVRARLDDDLDTPGAFATIDAAAAAGRPVGAAIALLGVAPGTPRRDVPFTRASTGAHPVGNRAGLQ